MQQMSDNALSAKWQQIFISQRAPGLPIPFHAFSGSLIPPLVIIYVASRSGQSARRWLCEKFCTKLTWTRTTYLESPEFLLRVHHLVPSSEEPVWSRRAQGYDLQQVYDRQLQRKGHWPQGRSEPGSSSKY